MTAENKTTSFQDKENEKTTISPWTWVTIGHLLETYPIETEFDVEKGRLVRVPAPNAITEVHDIKVPYFIIQALAKIGLHRKYQVS